MTVVWSTVIASNSAYTFHSGTSAAAPEVTGAAALLKGVAPRADAAALKRRIDSTVDPTLPGQVSSGGRLNVNLMTTPPDTAIAGGVANGGVGRGPSHGFSVSTTQVDTQLECSVDGAPFAPCNGGSSDVRTYSVGRHAFQARSTFYGLNDPSPASVTFWVDGPKGPVARIKAGPKGRVRSRVAKFKLAGAPSSSPGFAFQCKLDKKPFRACGRTKIYRGLALGGHRLEVRASDRSGPGPVVSRTWIITRR